MIVARGHHRRRRHGIGAPPPWPEDSSPMIDTSRPRRSGRLDHAVAGLMVVAMYAVGAGVLAGAAWVLAHA